MQALQWGILNAHVSALCLRAAFTRLAVLVVQVGAARQAGLLMVAGVVWYVSGSKTALCTAERAARAAVLRSRLASSTSSSSSLTFTVRKAAMSWLSSWYQ